VETSVYLEIYDGTPVTGATDVNIDVYDAAGSAKLASLRRTAVEPAAGTALLGSLVIYPGVHDRAGSLHVEAQRLAGNVIVSRGSVDVTLETGRQIQASLTLGTGVPAIDGGREAGTDAGAGGGDGGAGGAGGADAGRADAAADGAGDRGTLLPVGGRCRFGSECALGFCSDGFCCDSVCNGSCRACNVPGSEGRCVNAPAGTECAPASCWNGSEVPARRCDLGGNCDPGGPATSCGRYVCRTDSCLTSCNDPGDCVPPARCSFGRCQ
jgi:hypothetical protein